MPHSILVLKSSKNLSFIHTHLTFCLSGLCINCTVISAVAWTGNFWGGQPVFLCPRIRQCIFSLILLSTVWLLLRHFWKFGYLAIFLICTEKHFHQEICFVFWSFGGSVTQIKRCISEHFHSQTSALLDSRISVDFDFHWFLEVVN